MIFHELADLPSEFFVFASEESIHVVGNQIVVNIAIKDYSGVMHIDVFIRLDELLLIKAVVGVVSAAVNDIEDGHLICLSEGDCGYKHDLARRILFGF